MCKPFFCFSKLHTCKERVKAVQIRANERIRTRNRKEEKDTQHMMTCGILLAAYCHRVSNTSRTLLTEHRVFFCYSKADHGVIVEHNGNCFILYKLCRIFNGEKEEEAK